MKLFIFVLVLGVFFSGHRPRPEPVGGPELCGKVELFIWVEESKIGPGFVSCDVFNEFWVEEEEGNIQNAKKLMAYRRKMML